MVNRIPWKETLVLAAVVFSCAISEEKKMEPSGKQVISFNDLALGKLPSGWQADATNPKGKLAEWKVVEGVLSIVKIHDTSGGVFNLCWTRDLSFQNGTIEVRVRADSGEEDQGGGLIWRAKDANNYYIARYNPLEKNFRLYFVKDGKRKQLADASDPDVKTSEWFTVKIVHRGEKIEGWLNGKKLLEATDRTFLESGGIGFWTKADAASSFDDLVIEADAGK